MNIGDIVTMDIGLFITFCGKFVEDIITYEDDFTSAVVNCDLSEQMEIGLGDCDKYSSINYHVFNYLKKFNSKIRNVYITENSITDGGISGTMSAMPHARNNYLIFTEEELVVSTLDVTFSDDDDITMNYGEDGKHLEENPTINSLKIKLNLGYYVDVVKEIENLDFYDKPLREQLKIITILGCALNNLDASHEDILGKSITKIKILDMSRKIIVYVESLNTDDINNNIIDNYYIREYGGKILFPYKAIFWRNTLSEDENTVERLIEKIDKGQERSAYK